MHKTFLGLVFFFAVVYAHSDEDVRIKTRAES
jgi:hypothetical protein